MKFLIFIYITLIVQIKAQTFSLGKFSVGQSRIKIDLKDFSIINQNKDINAKFIPDSIQWIRNESNLLTPRVLVEINLNYKLDHLQLKYLNKNIIPVLENDRLISKVYIDLFNPQQITIFQNQNVLDQITIKANSLHANKSKQLIDYSCAPYDIKIEGIDDEYVSVGCKLEKIGEIFNELPRLEVTISSTNLRTLAKDFPPFIFYFNQTSRTPFKVLDADGKESTIYLSAKLPAKYHRLKMAFGLGPYMYKSSLNTNEINATPAPSFMLYGKFDLTETSSLKAFDALLYGKSFFNNSGYYFSYDLAEIFDGRILINTLLGFQGLHYRYSKNDTTEFGILYPQGFEVIYKHAFDQENYNLTYGMFLTTSGESYKNLWVRYGKSSFLELNYIDWSKNQSRISMWGISIGIPFFQAL